MPSQPPAGEPAPEDGSLPESARAGLGDRPFGVYVHVPYCSTRCGYCDFNTYTAAELGGGASQDSYADNAVHEVRLAREVLGDVDLPARTVFFGGGTPTVLPVTDLARILDAISDSFGLTPDVEVTTEANPDSVTAESLAGLRAAGFTRISYGMQSAAPHVLAVLDRTHTPGRAQAAVAEAHAAGFEHVNLDLIYGAPGESLTDWAESLDVALEAEPDHLSAYALVVEEGTRLAARVRRGDLAAPDDDDLADKYLLAGERLEAAGLGWYEVSNWSASVESRCRHNLLYWTGGDWWGVGPGAHSHVGGTRWWNVRHPRDYATAVTAGRSPAQSREVLDEDARHVERVLLGLRLSEGLELLVLDPPGRATAAVMVDEGLLEADRSASGRAVLTATGRLLTDTVVRRLLNW